MRERLDLLARLGDCDSLKSGVGELCAEFGRVRQIDILTVAQAGRRRALCFLRLDSAQHEADLMLALGATRFGSDVLIVVDLAPRAPSPDRS